MQPHFSPKELPCRLDAQVIYDLQHVVSPELDQ